MISTPLKRLRDEEIILQIGLAWYSQTLPLPRFFDAHASTLACAVFDDALRANAALLFTRMASAMRVLASRV